MDSLSSDDEYFDTYLNLNDENIKQSESLFLSADGIIETSQMQPQDDIASVTNLHDYDTNYLKMNDSSDTKNKTESFHKQCGDSHDSAVITGENDEICANIDSMKLDTNDSSDSEAMLDELVKCDDNDKCESNESNIPNKVNNGVDHNIEKSNEEIQLEERLKQESLLSDENLDTLRDNSLQMKNDGNSCFQLQSYDEAIKLYTNAIETCPLRFKDDHAIFHSNRGSALSKLDKNEDAIKDLSIALELKPDYLKALLKRAELLEKSDKFKEALDDYRLVLQIDPRNWTALNAEQTLPEKIKIQQEKMKEEMLGQLKQLGNLVLKPFGLSTDNFKMVQDPSTGSYSINFQNK